jgi:hypothetical protein
MRVGKALPAEFSTIDTTTIALLVVDLIYLSIYTCWIKNEGHCGVARVPNLEVPLVAA